MVGVGGVAAAVIVSLDNLFVFELVFFEIVAMLIFLFLTTGGDADVDVDVTVVFGRVFFNTGVVFTMAFFANEESRNNSSKAARSSTLCFFSICTRLVGSVITRTAVGYRDDACG